MSKCYIMVGLPGSGKTTYAKKLNANIHSTDLIRKEWYGDENIQGDNNKIYNEVLKRIINDIKNNQDTVLDGTNIKRKNRIYMINRLKKYDCEIICEVIMTSYENCLKQNNNRSRYVPEQVIKNMYLKWDTPYYFEGFDKINLHFNEEDIKSNQWNLLSLMTSLNIDQKNKHHSLTISEHCIKTRDYIKENNGNELVKYAGLLHDIGKLFTMESDGESCHYYNHQHVGSYLSIFFTKSIGFKDDDSLYISTLINFHMKPLLSWNEDKNKIKDKKLIGNKMFSDLLLLNKADIAAH